MLNSGLVDSPELQTLFEEMIDDMKGFYKSPRQAIEFINDPKTVDIWHSFAFWAWENGRTVEDGLTGIGPDMQRLLKKKYLPSMLTQFRYGQMIPSIEWQGKQVNTELSVVLQKIIYNQVMIWSGADFGTDKGQCHFLSGVVHDEAAVLSTMEITTGAYPGKEQGFRMLLDAEIFDSGLGRATSQGFVISHFFWKNAHVLSQSGLNIEVSQWHSAAMM